MCDRSATQLIAGACVSCGIGGVLASSGRSKAGRAGGGAIDRAVRSLGARLAAALRRAADRLQPLPPPRPPRDPRLARLPLIPGFERLDQRAWEDGRVRVAFSATDPVWGVGVEDDGMVPLREHVRRLCVSSHELATFPLAGRWDDVAHNLELAHSLTDVFADTDIDSSAMWCGPAADYEAADSEVAAKHLAAVIVFTLVWTAYECAVDMMVSGGGGKGARGRDLVAMVAPPDVPHLRETLFVALELDPDGTAWGSRDARRLIGAGNLAGMAGEHLRQFRNRSIHGDQLGRSVRRDPFQHPEQRVDVVRGREYVGRDADDAGQAPRVHVQRREGARRAADGDPVPREFGDGARDIDAGDGHEARQVRPLLDDHGAAIEPSAARQWPAASGWRIVATIGMAESRSSPRISLASSRTANTTQPISVGARIGVSIRRYVSPPTVTTASRSPPLKVKAAWR